MNRFLFQLQVCWQLVQVVTFEVQVTHSGGDSAVRMHQLLAFFVVLLQWILLPQFRAERLPLCIDLNASSRKLVALLILATKAKDQTVGALAEGAPNDLFLQIDRGNLEGLLLREGGSGDQREQREEQAREVDAGHTGPVAS